MHVKILSAFWKLLTGQNKRMAKKRLAICSTCDLRTGSKKSLACSVCGCWLIAKTRDEEETCPHPLGPKW